MSCDGLGEIYETADTRRQIAPRPAELSSVYALRAYLKSSENSNVSPNTVDLKKITLVFEYPDAIGNKECRTMKFGKDFCYFDIHYSLFDILRFNKVFPRE